MIYLDYNATTPIRPEVIEITAKAMNAHGNASSIHGCGRNARKMVEEARAHVGAMAGVSAKQVIFNSGATEANNTILRGYTDRPLLVSAIEHPSAYFCGRDIIEIPVLSNGLIDMNAFTSLLRKHKNPVVSVMLVNNETGVIQPVRDIARMVKEVDGIMHTDAAQAAGRIAIDFDELDVDFMSLCAHKFGGPQGVGALIFRQGMTFPKFIHGGGQEKRARAGTENVAGIAGFGEASRLAIRDLKEFQKLSTLRDKMIEGILASSPKVTVYGLDAPRVSNTVSCSVEGINSAIFLINLDLEQVCISSGAACSSGAVKPSRVLLAMGVSEEISKTGLRISMGWNTQEAEIEQFLKIWTKLIRRMEQ